MKYIGDLPHIRDDKEYSSAEIDFGQINYVSYEEAKKNAQAYIERNQYMTSSCVPSSICNALWNTEKVILAQEPNYRQRVNYPNSGCSWTDQLDLAINFGMAERDIVPEVDMERALNKFVVTSDMTENAKKHKQKSYVFIKDYNDFVSTLNQGFPIVFSIFSNGKEYGQAKPEVKSKLTINNAPIRHAICAIPNTAFDGGFFITDSFQIGDCAKREITKDFFSQRLNFLGAFFIDLDNKEKPTKPKKYEWKRDLTIGDEGEDVLKLQQALQSLGFFPSNIKPSGKFLGITRQAVKDFQKKYEKSILWSVGLKLPTGYFGKSSQKQLNLLLS